MKKLKIFKDNPESDTGGYPHKPAEIKWRGRAKEFPE
jgi:hypothetical protein